ncbi:MAG: hypothetical protein V3U78_07865 [Thiotrichaceae bacterium]
MSNPCQTLGYWLDQIAIIVLKVFTVRVADKFAEPVILAATGIIALVP